jgi:thymidine phosphorylase
MDVLGGKGPSDVAELTAVLGGAMVELAHGVSLELGRERIERALADGSAMERWRRMVAAQGGDLAGLPRPTGEVAVLAPRGGFVGAIDGREVGLVAMQLGAGRARREDAIDLAVGIRIERKVGERVEAGEALATILTGVERRAPEALIERLREAFSIGPEPPEARPLVLARVG